MHELLGEGLKRKDTGKNQVQGSSKRKIALQPGDNGKRVPKPICNPKKQSKKMTYKSLQC